MNFKLMEINLILFIFKFCGYNKVLKIFNSMESLKCHKFLFKNILHE